MRTKIKAYGFELVCLKQWLDITSRIQQEKLQTAKITTNKTETFQSTFNDIASEK